MLPSLILVDRESRRGGSYGSAKGRVWLHRRFEKDRRGLQGDRITECSSGIDLRAIQVSRKTGFRFWSFA